MHPPRHLARDYDPVVWGKRATLDHAVTHEARNALTLPPVPNDDPFIETSTDDQPAVATRCYRADPMRVAFAQYNRQPEFLAVRRQVPHANSFVVAAGDRIAPVRTH